MIIADENIELSIINSLRENGFQVLSVREESPGISDIDVVRLAETNEGFLITEDKDFGELVFSHRLEKVSVLFLRLSQPVSKKDLHRIVAVLEEYLNRKENLFITLTGDKVRVTNL